MKTWGIILNFLCHCCLFNLCNAMIQDMENPFVDLENEYDMQMVGFIVLL